MSKNSLSKEVQDAQDEAGKRLKKFRTEVTKKTQIEFATPLDYKQPAYQSVEKGVNSITFKLLYGLIKAYGLNINWLITGEGPMFITDSTNPSEKMSHNDLEQLLQLVEVERDKYKEMWENAEDHIENYKSLLMEALRKR
ncbi:MAG: helix-turn-helix transcriptional regulator [Bacteroidota bacterium]